MDEKPLKRLPRGIRKNFKSVWLKKNLKLKCKYLFDISLINQYFFATKKLTKKMALTSSKGRWKKKKMFFSPS